MQSKPWILCLVLSASASIAWAAPVSFSTPGGSYTQNFDSLASIGTTHGNSAAWADGATPAGWYFRNNSGAVPSTIFASNGSAGSQNRPLSLGSTDSSDRALGSQSNDGVSNIHFGLALVNDTGSTIDSFTLTYTGEQWRRLSGEAQDRLAFGYETFASGGSLVSGTYTAVAALDFPAPITAGSGGLDGNLAANSDLISFTVTGVGWAAGEELWLRWSDVTPTATNIRAQMGIDDLTFTAVPEPSTWLLVAASAAMLAFRRRCGRKG